MNFDSTSNPRADPLPAGFSGELLEQTAWLRRLAHALVGNDSTADDLVQDALGIAAMRRDSIRNLPAFLAGTLRRLATRSARTAARRRRREELCARSEALPASDQLAERVDTLRVVLEELRLLPAAQERVISLRFLEGLEATEIAQREGIAASTVRANLARGLAELRRRLDRRSGSRDAWCTVLLPLLAGSPAGPPLPAPHLSACSGAGITTSGILLMTASTKTIALLLTPLLGVGIWFASSSSGSKALTPETIKEGAPASHELNALEIPSTPDTGRALAAPEQEQAKAPESSSGTPKPQLFRTQLVDALTGEAVPELELQLTIDGSPVKLVSDAQGFVEEELSLQGSACTVMEREEHGGWFRVPSPRALTLPVADHLSVHVGPTFRLLMTVPAGLQLSDLCIFFDESPRRSDPPPESTVRAGELPWVRFPFEVTTLEAGGSWSLRVEDREGLWRASAEVTRKRGIEALAVPLQFEATGAAHVVLEQLEGNRNKRLFLDLESVADGERTRSGLKSEAQGPAHARFLHLQAGRYQWILGGDSGRRGEFEVIAGETTEVFVPAEAELDTFAAEVVIDTSADLNMDLSQARAMVVNVDDLESGFATKVTRRESDPAGLWRIQLEDLPVGRWQVMLTQPLEAAVWDPPTIAVQPGGDVGRIKLVVLGAMVSVAIRVVDSAGEDIVGAEGMHSFDNLTFTMINQDGRGGLMKSGMPSDYPSTVILRAPGHRSRAIQHQPSMDGKTLEVELEAGWSNFVHVIDMGSMQAADGITVFADGVEVGVTDDRGEVWIEGEKPPATIELQADGLEVIRSPIDTPDEGSDPLGGWLFLVRNT